MTVYEYVLLFVVCIIANLIANVYIIDPLKKYVEKRKLEIAIRKDLKRFHIIPDKEMDGD